MSVTLNRDYTSTLEEPLVLGAIDVLIVNIGFVLAFYLRFGVTLASNPNFRTYLALAPILSAAAVILLYAYDLYTNWVQRSLSEITYSLTLVSVELSFIAMAASFWARRFNFPRSVLGVAIGLHILLFTSVRCSIVKFLRAHYGGKRIVIVANTTESASDLAMKLQESAPGSYLITGFMRASEPDALDLCIENIDTVVITADAANRAEIVRYATRCGKAVLIAPHPYELTVFGGKPWYLDDCMMLSIEQHHLTSFEMLIKRTMDILISSAALIITSPVFLLLCSLIPLESKGSAFFRQVRVGRNGDLYSIWKFRTMVADAEKTTGPTLASLHDSRITRLGAFLRATRLDELPQFFNVLRGEMSVVGPRPERPHFVVQFEDCVPGYSARFAVKPGITGLAQVMGRYDTSAERKLRFDLMYIYKYSVVLDLKILFQTLRVILRREQASGVSKPVMVEVPTLVVDETVSQANR